MLLVSLSGFDPKNQFAKTPFCDTAAIAASAKRHPLAHHLTTAKNHRPEGRSDATILAILTIFSGANHVDGAPPALA